MNKRFNINLVLENDTLFADTNQITQTPEEIEHDLDGLESSMERQLEIHNALEDLAEIASTIDTPTPREVALFQTAANMAVAGTDNEASDILPAMEAFKPLAIEGFADKVKESIKKIIQYFKDMWNKFSDWIKSFFNNKNKELDNNLKKLLSLISNIKKGDSSVTLNPSKFLVKTNDIYDGSSFREFSQASIKGITDFTSEMKDSQANIRSYFAGIIDKFMSGEKEIAHQEGMKSLEETEIRITNAPNLLNDALYVGSFTTEPTPSTEYIKFLEHCHHLIKAHLQQNKTFESIFNKNIEINQTATRSLEKAVNNPDNTDDSRLVIQNDIKKSKLEIKHAQIQIKIINFSTRILEDLLNASIKLAKDCTMSTVINK
jgi:hypothetical protein